ncbi:hypothetical protein D3C72_2525150 [compost metagenome]
MEMVTLSSSAQLSTITVIPVVRAACRLQLSSSAQLSRRMLATMASAMTTPSAADSVGVASPP